jgi:hypothetical protein
VESQAPWLKNKSKMVKCKMAKWCGSITFYHFGCWILLFVSGQPTPNKSDMKITRKIKDSGALFEISVLDHIIVGHDNCYSFADVGSL